MKNMTILKIKCKKHRLQKACATWGGYIYCEECVKENNLKKKLLEEYK